MNKELAPVDQIAGIILFLRGEKVLLDSDLARLYAVPAKVLNQAVKRNRDRFPNDFMFQLTAEEVRILRSQILTGSCQTLEKKGLTKSWSQFVTTSRLYRRSSYRPYAFTEQGVAMLSSVLKSKRAIKVNIAIMRAFVKLRATLETNKELARKFAELEKHVGKHDEEIAAVIEAIRQLMAPPEKPRREIGFHVRETAPRYRTTRRR